MPHDAAEQLVDCFSTGAEEAKKFRRQRMDSDEVSFWSKISKLNLKTFASLAKQIKSSAQMRRSALLQLIGICLEEF